MAVKLAYIFLLLAFDSITFLLTVYYTATQYRFVARHGITRLSKLFMSIVEGAVMYFGILAVCHAVLVAGVLTWRARILTTVARVESSDRSLQPTLKFLPAWCVGIFGTFLAFGLIYHTTCTTARPYCKRTHAQPKLSFNQLECFRFTCILINRMSISTLKANQEDVRIPGRQPPPVSVTGRGASQLSNLHSRKNSSEPPEGPDIVDGTYGGAAVTILSSVHVCT